MVIVTALLVEVVLAALPPEINTTVLVPLNFSEEVHVNVVSSKASSRSGRVPTFTVNNSSVIVGF